MTYNADGQILTRKDRYKDGTTWKQGKDEGGVQLQNIAPRLIDQAAWSALTKAQRESWYDARDTQRMTYAAGQLVASQDEAGKLDATGQLTGFSNTRMGRTQVQVQQGDTLKSLAQRVYGNENLWYVLADANGLQGDDALVAGSSLTVPEVKTSSNDASTFKPYNPSEITGPTTPSLPYIPPPDQGCGAIGILIMVAVAVVVAVYAGPAATAYFQTAFGATAGAVTAAGATTLAGSTAAMVGGAIAGGAVAGAASAAASSAIGSLMGVASFSWRGVAASALSGAITAGIGARFGSVADALSGANPNIAKAAGLALANAGANYAGQKLAGVDVGFSWKSIAASAVSSIVSAKVAGKVNFGSEFANDFAVGMAGGMVSAAVREALNEGGRTNYMTIVADAFGNALGNRLAARMATAGVSSMSVLSPEESESIGQADGASGWDRFATTNDQVNPSNGTILNGILARYASPREGGSGGPGRFDRGRDVLGDRARMVQRLEGLGLPGADSVNIANNADYQEYLSTYGHFINTTERGYIPTLSTVEVNGAQQAVADNLSQGVGWGVYSRAAIVNATATSEDRRANYNRWLTQTYAATRGNVGPAGKTFMSDDQFSAWKNQSLLDAGLESASGWLEDLRSRGQQNINNSSGGIEAAFAVGSYAVNELTTAVLGGIVDLARLGTNGARRDQLLDGLGNLASDPIGSVARGWGAWSALENQERLRLGGAMLATLGGGTATLQGGSVRAATAGVVADSGAQISSKILLRTASRSEWKAHYASLRRDGLTTDVAPSEFSGSLVEFSRRADARTFLSQEGLSPKYISQVFSGIDFSKGIKITTLRQGDIVGQWVKAGRVGNWFAPLGQAPELSGLARAMRQPVAFEAVRNVRVLESIAKPIVDTWTLGPAYPIATPGGGLQFFAPSNAYFSPITGP